MPNITRCTACGVLYEESSWEAANDPRPEKRRCPTCHKALQPLIRQCHCGEPLRDDEAGICDGCWNIELASGYLSPREEEC